MNPISRNHVTVWGKPNAEQTLVFGHGFGTTQEDWKNTADAFSDRYRVVTYDNVGEGKSNKDAYSHLKYGDLRGYAIDLLEILDILELSHVIYVGHSVSSMVGVLAANARQGAFEKMILIGGSPRYLNDGQYIGGFTEEDLEQVFQTMESNYYDRVSGFAPMAMAQPQRLELAEYFAGTLKEIRPDVAISVAKAIFYSDLRSELPNMQVETLILQPQADVVVPVEVGHYLLHHLPNASLQLMPTTGHFPHISDPDIIQDAISRFIEPTA